MTWRLMAVRIGLTPRWLFTRSMEGESPHSHSKLREEGRLSAICRVVRRWLSSLAGMHDKKVKERQWHKEGRYLIALPMRGQ